uniref:sugar ABC transporter permease n=1 Tax=Acinetobacter baumannii TaxID=470 RepID=UPI0013D14F61
GDAMTIALAEPAGTRRRSFMARKKTRQVVLIWCFLAPSLLIFLLYRILPLAWNLVLSFQAWSPLRPAVWVGLD